jgi:hypothetical protein
MQTTTPNRQTLYEQMRAAAIREARPGETPEQALVRYLDTPAGREQYAAYREAPPAPPSPPPAPLPAVETACQRSVLRDIDAAAARLQRAHPELTFEQAYARAVEAEPQLYQDYLAAKRADERLAALPPPPRVAAREPAAAPAPAPRPAAATVPASNPPPDPRAVSHWAWQMVCREYPNCSQYQKKALHERFLAAVR